jgi:hypothetical protein
MSVQTGLKRWDKAVEQSGEDRTYRFTSHRTRLKTMLATMLVTTGK